MRGRKPELTPDPGAIKDVGAEDLEGRAVSMTILDPLTGQTVSIDRPARNPRRAYDKDGREIPPMTLANMRA